MGAERFSHLQVVAIQAGTKAYRSGRKGTIQRLPADAIIRPGVECNVQAIKT
jgi:hypothetical protein